MYMDNVSCTVNGLYMYISNKADMIYAEKLHTCMSINYELGTLLAYVLCIGLI